MIECSFCHLDSIEEDMIDGMCSICWDTFESDRRFSTEFERMHGHDFDDWSNNGR